MVATKQPAGRPALRFDLSAGQWFPAEFQMLVQNAFPAVP